MPERPHDDEGQATIRESEIDGIRQELNRGFQDCIDAIPEVGGILSRGAEIGWKAVEEKCCEYLLERLAGSPEAAEEQFQVGRIANEQAVFEGGSEHYIVLHSDDSQEDVIKWTYGNNFGLRLKVYEIDPLGMDQNVIGVGNMDPRYYLKRWMILNSIGPPITKFEGLLPPDIESRERLPRLCISQKRLPSQNPSRGAIVSAFRDIDFIEIAEDAFYRIEDNILLGDAAPRNVRVVGGVIVPFDAVAEHPADAARMWCEKRVIKSR